jgi:hypothetical protein
MGNPAVFSILKSVMEGSMWKFTVENKKEWSTTAVKFGPDSSVKIKLRAYK